MFKKLTAPLIATVATVLFTSLASAQNVHLRGQIEDADVGFGFVIDCTDIALTSSAVDLNQFMDMHFEADGVFNGSATAPAIDITSIQVVPKSFSISGGASIGGRMDFVATANPGDMAILAASLDSGATLLGSSVLMLDPQSMLVLGTVVANVNGEGKISIHLPSNQALVGLEVFGQAAIFPSAGGPYYLSNPDCKTISN